MIKVTIDRTKWIRGANKEESMLLTPSGKMCCLGFASKALGCTDADINCKYYPAGTSKILDGLTKVKEGDSSVRTFDGDYATGRFNVLNTGFSQNAANINDNSHITDQERERQLIELAKDNGFEFVFVN